MYSFWQLSICDGQYWSHISCQDFDTPISVVHALSIVYGYHRLIVYIIFIICAIVLNEIEMARQLTFRVI